MYARYTRTRVGADVTRYQFQEQVSLFGCNNGFMPWLLSLKIPPGQGEPYLWHAEEMGSGMSIDLSRRPISFCATWRSRLESSRTRMYSRHGGGVSTRSSS